MSEALKKLLAALAVLGYDEDNIEIRRPTAAEIDNRTPPTDIFVFITGFHEDNEVRITITSEYWRYPGLVCYFVNYSNKFNGNFMACVGTPHLEKALFDLGQAIHMMPCQGEERSRFARVKLPEGIKSIQCEDETVIGTMLRVETNGGVLIRIDALGLTPDAEGQVCIHTHKSDDFIDGYDIEKGVGIFYETGKKPEVHVLDREGE